MPIVKIKKRNGAIVDFNSSRIEYAIQKAFHATCTPYAAPLISELVTIAIQELDEKFSNRLLGVEDVQDCVERAIAKKGFFEVARAYIIYRYEHQKERQKKQEEFIEKIEKNELMVLKQSGLHEPFSLEKIKTCIRHFTRTIEDDVQPHVLALQCRTELYDGIATKYIFRSLIMTARSLIEQDPSYSTLAARLLFHDISKEVIGNNFSVEYIAMQYREAFVKNIHRGVALERLDPRVLTYDIDMLSNALKPERDDLFKFLGAQVLADRYLLRDTETGRILETPQAFWMRVAMGLAFKEKNKNERALEFYEIISTFRYVPSTPTLFHSGTHSPQLASCYLNTVSDSLDHIFKVISDNAQLSKWSGGIGTDWTNIRGTGSLIKGTGVESQGVIPFLKIANDATVAINRSGRRRGAACVYLEVWHYDIEDFLELRKNTGDERRRTHDINTAAWIPDLFMKRVRDDGEWTLFSPNETPDLHHIYGKKFETRYAFYETRAREGTMRAFKTLRARDLWKKMLAMLFETGHPWITFKDPCNVRSPQDHAGVVHNSNLCTEITLNNSEEETAVCNLGSIHLGKHITNGVLDGARVQETVSCAMRMLDNVIDLNFYPTEETRASNLRHRPVGLGIMGFQDAVYMLHRRFDSEETLRFADESMEIISYHAILASTELAKERGAYSSFTGSKWDRGMLPMDTLNLLEQERGEPINVSRAHTLDWTLVRNAIKTYGMRNSNCVAIAPTATIGNIADAIPGIEPIYKNIYAKANMSGDFIVINPYLVADLKRLRLWDFEMLGKLKYHDGSIKNIPEIPEELKETYKEVFEIDPQWLVRIAAHRGKWIDQSQSLNIFFRGTSGKLLQDVYFSAWALGLKTTYYLRTLAASQVEKSTISTAIFGSTHTRAPSSFEETPNASSDQPLSVCKIDDPACESCQ
jgi:ribonucleoside-diphosphate reductase alpha chain